MINSLNNLACTWAEEEAEEEDEAFDTAVRQLIHENKQLKAENKDLRERLSRTQEEEYE